MLVFVKPLQEIEYGFDAIPAAPDAALIIG
jgi:hypothetical protein